MDGADPERQALAHVESLIQQLYGGNASPDAVAAIQSELQSYQSRDPFGWILADHLLGSRDVNARFFGALTFTVKINQQPQGEDDSSVLSKLLDWFVHFVSRDEPQLVLRKLSSALVTLFVQPRTRWRRPVRHVLYCLNSGAAVAESSIECDTTIEVLLRSLSDQVLQSLLAFTTTLAEESVNVPHNSEYSSCHERLKENLHDVMSLLHFLFKSALGQQEQFQGDLLDAYQAWISYTRATFSRSSDREYIDIFKQLLVPIMGYLLRADTFDSTAEFLIDLFTANDDDFVSEEQFAAFSNLLDSDWANSQLRDLVPEPTEDSLTFARLVLSFGQAMANRLVNDRHRQNTDRILSLMHYITRSIECDTIDQAVGGAICDFWDNYTISVPVDDIGNAHIQQTLSEARRTWKQAIGELCHAAALPLGVNGDFITVTSEHPMTEFRSRVRSTMQASYDDFGFLVLESLVSTALGAYGIGKHSYQD